MNKKLFMLIGAVALLAIIGIVLFLTRGSQSPISQQRVLYDVVTGERRTISNDRIPILPMRNSNGQPALYPIVQDESGNWVITDLYHSVLRNHIAEGSLPSEGLRIDLRTFALP